MYFLVLSGFKTTTTSRKYYIYSMTITGAIQEFKNHLVFCVMLQGIRPYIAINA